MALTSVGWCQGGGTAPYDVLTDNRHDVTNLNVESVNPMEIDPATLELFAVNTHGSFVRVWDLNAPADPPTTYPTLWHPVTLRLFDDRVLVVGGGTHAIVAHDRVSGKILQHLTLPSEPADMVIDPDGTAQIGEEEVIVGWGFIACQGADVVVQVRLDTLEEMARFEIPSQRPRFLSFDRGEVSDPLDNRVYVAPMISGNNTTFVREEGGDPDNDFEVLDLSDPTVAPQGGLPDEDLFALDPRAGTLQAVVRSAGSILFEHATNPVTGKHWMLVIDSHNATHPVTGQKVTNEPELNGFFASNGISIVDSLNPSMPPVEPQTSIDLDLNPPTKSCSTPYAISFSSTGFGLVASSTGDLVSIHDPNGVRLLDRPLSRGAIPRDVMTIPGLEDFIAVYCWGTNKIEIYRIVPWVAQAVLVLDLGIDPHSDAVKKGRQIWYDADRSKDSKLTCNHCHVAGGFDGLGWPLAGEPEDFKDVMVTQSLLGIEDTFPYHWRGERDLPAFNEAFVGLLGGEEELREDEFTVFEEFIFTLQGAANPRQNFRRELDNADFTEAYLVDDSPGSPIYPIGRPVEGQILYQTPGVDGGFSCASCHGLPSGTGNDVQGFSSVVPRRQNIEMPHFRELADKNQEMITVDVDPSSHPMLAANTLVIPSLGFGTGHNGHGGNLFRFVRDQFQSSNPGDVLHTDQSVSDLTAFMEAFDEGIAPAIHTSRLVRQDTLGAQTSDILNLIDQARFPKRWIDLVAVGETLVSGTPIETRWHYDPLQDLFVCNRPGIGPWSWTQFSTETSNGDADHLFVGVPSGNGARFGNDLDGDGTTDGDEIVAGTNPFDPLSPDVNGNQIPDGWEGNGSPTFTLTPDFGTLTLKKFFLEASEPVLWHAEYASSAGGPTLTLDSVDYARTDTVVLQHLAASHPAAPQTYTITKFEVTDYEGNKTTSFPAPFTTGEMLSLPGVVHTIVGDAQWVSPPNLSGGVVSGSAKLRVDARAASPPGFPVSDHVIIAQVLFGDEGEQPQVVTNLSSPSGLKTSFKLDDVVYNPPQVDGAFLVSEVSADSSHPTLGVGEVIMDFSFSGATAGQEVTLSVFAIFPATAPETDPPTPYDPADPNFDSGNTHLWVMMATPPDFRSISEKL